ncbi:uncharacterized protein B0H18DRAFT_965250 [Fomitopsis serialis]|uniref:uncharacterized protein n=1 Tax=Fomitopsis serialis TaxID=139415 RepID=UPI002007AB73|nr:uncharacterized protein B0H18DRAFT_965250 [Neoantrodia serialis]KAH9938048.1 hypothetical protein B0H18DRAFT_965250 [Neoantrodia serialis]
MPLLLAFVAGLVLVRVADSDRSVNGRAGSSEAVPRHVVGTSATVALHRGEGRRVQGAARGRGARSESSTSTTCVRARPRDMAKASAVVALLAGTLYPQARALRLYMTDSAAGVALLRSDRAGLRACRRLVSGLTAVVAETLLRRTILRDVSDYNGACGL